MNNNTPTLKLSHDRKVRYYNNQKNSLGLLPGPEGTCPYATQGEGGCWNVPHKRKLYTCYVDKCMTLYPNVRGLLEHNTNLLKNANTATQTELLNNTFEVFKTKEYNKTLKDNSQGSEKSRLNFRLHWAGDIYDRSYAVALRDAMLNHKDIFFWMYTRSFPWVPILKDVNNLSLFLSLDHQNINQGLETYCQNKWPNLKIAYMAPEDDWQTQLKKLTGFTSEELKILRRIKLTPCPVDTGKMELVESCIKCKLCLRNDKKIHIWFKTK